MQIAFDTATELKEAIDDLFAEFPAALYYGLDSIAPFPDFQSHNGIEMYYVWSGSGGYLVGNRIYPLKPGSLMIVRPYTPHKVLQTDAAHNVCRHVLIWKEELIPSAALEQSFQPLKLHKHDCVHIQANPEQQTSIEAIYKQIQCELTQKNSGFDTMIRCYIQQLLTIAQRIDEQSERTDPSLTIPHVPKEIVYLVQYVGSYFQHRLTLTQLASLVHMNPPYLTSLFHKHTGFTLGKFIAQKRLHHAKKLLRETELSVSTIALECGFGGASYFIKLFKRQERMTPEAYRNLVVRLS